MKKINVGLSEEAHMILTDYKLTHKHSTLDAALDELLREWASRNQLFRR
jgi:hypothetical protein